jgi:hypothetical protein
MMRFSWKRRLTLGELTAHITRLREKRLPLARAAHAGALQKFERGYIIEMRAGSPVAARLSADLEATARKLFRVTQELEDAVQLEQKLLRQDAAARSAADRRHAKSLLREHIKHAADHQQAARQAAESFNAMHDIRVTISEILGRPPGDAFEPFTEDAAKAAFSRTVHDITRGRWTPQNEMREVVLDTEAVLAVLNSEFPEE